MWPKYTKRVDLESGGPSALYPGMIESPDLRWAFIRKIYMILTVQLALTAAVAAVVVSVKSISHFFVSSSAGLGLYIFLIILPFIRIFISPFLRFYSLLEKALILFRCVFLFLEFMALFLVGNSAVLCPLYIYRERHPVNLLLLGLFTLSISFAVGMSCAFTSGKVILEAAILTTVVVVSLTLYTFWASRRGHDFNFLGPFLFAAVLVLLVFGLIQILFPLGKISVMIYGGLGALIFSGYIIYDTDNLIKRFTYDQYVWAAVSLYLDVINLFLSLLTLLRAADS
ncbi:hypothetical protein C4D60_Mb08t20150 [Musa balbisiana]|uniref:BI1-like protein n=1 Tax=Musa balbisiana TaxID=52838 RepID=A0A4S8K533_MUSBA|nr:hypothetical protein C4D60_Mb08t20150 [Musa balbisiana]